MAEPGFYVKLREPCAENANGYTLKRWHVKPSALRVKDGTFDFSTRVITVCRSLKLPTMAGCLWHEVIHVSNPDLCEEAVLRTEHNLVEASILAGLLGS